MTKKRSFADPGIMERISAIRKQLDHNQNDSAKKVECPRNRISDMERGSREIPKNAFSALCAELSIDMNWFVMGRGSMPQDKPNYQPSRSHEASDQQTEFLDTLIEEKEELIGEKKARLKLLEQMLNSQ